VSTHLGTTAVQSLEISMQTPAPTDNTFPQMGPREIVEEFLRLMMVPAPLEAQRYTSPELKIWFTGGRAMAQTSECAAFNAQRYAWVKKKFACTDVAQGTTDNEAIVYQTGTLYGAWPGGTPFEGNRYIDRYVVRDGLIVEMQVWNDSAEWMLVRAGLAAPWPSPMNPETQGAQA
jgi:hypothetical protein